MLYHKLIIINKINLKWNNLIMRNQGSNQDSIQLSTMMTMMTKNHKLKNTKMLKKLFQIEFLILRVTTAVIYPTHQP